MAGSAPLLHPLSLHIAINHVGFNPAGVMASGLNRLCSVLRKQQDMLGLSCWVSYAANPHAGTLMLGPSCLDPHAGTLMLGLLCWDPHARTLMLGPSCWDSHAGTFMLGPSC